MDSKTLVPQQGQAHRGTSQKIWLGKSNFYFEIPQDFYFENQLLEKNAFSVYLCQNICVPPTLSPSLL